MVHTFIPVVDDHDVIDAVCEACGVSWDEATAARVGCERGRATRQPLGPTPYDVLQRRYRAAARKAKAVV